MTPQNVRMTRRQERWLRLGYYEIPASAIAKAELATQRALEQLEHGRIEGARWWLDQTRGYHREAKRVLAAGLNYPYTRETTATVH